MQKKKCKCIKLVFTPHNIFKSAFTLYSLALASFCQMVSPWLHCRTKWALVKTKANGIIALSESLIKCRLHQSLSSTLAYSDVCVFDHQSACIEHPAVSMKCHHSCAQTLWVHPAINFLCTVRLSYMCVCISTHLLKPSQKLLMDALAFAHVLF